MFYTTRVHSNNQTVCLPDSRASELQQQHTTQLDAAPAVCLQVQNRCHEGICSLLPFSNQAVLSIDNKLHMP